MIAHEVSMTAPMTEKLTPGAYSFFEWHNGGGPGGVIIACPCGCGARSVVHFRGRGKGAQEWYVDGDWPLATLRPMIAFNGDHWRGVLRDGEFIETTAGSPDASIRPDL